MMTKRNWHRLITDSLQADLLDSFEDRELENTKPLQDKIDRITGKKNKIIDWCLDGKIDDDEMQALTEKYHKEIAGLKTQIAEANNRNSFIENAKDNIELTLNAMRDILSQEETTPELYSAFLRASAIAKTALAKKTPQITHPRLPVCSNEN